jgi:RNA-binding protein NOB1
VNQDDERDDDDTRSEISNITTATITPSESASAIFHNPFQTLHESSSENSTPRTQYTLPSSVKSSSAAVASNTSTVRTTDPSPSTIATHSLVSQRTTATDDTVTDVSTPSHLEQYMADLTISSSDEDDGEGTWITPTNIKKHKLRDTTATNSLLSGTSTARRRSSPTVERSTAVLKAACMTADFSMQNVALQMGLNLISTEGYGIRSVKTWILRCHGCFNTTKKMELKFCPFCGGDTLLRASTSTNANGQVQIHLKKNMQWTNRGTKVFPPENNC